MMPFRFLTRPKATLQLQAPDTCLSGTTVGIEAAFRTKEQVSPRQVTIELLGKETWYDRVTSGKQTHIVKRDETFARVPVSFPEQHTLYQGSERRWKASLAVPADASPSAKGSVVDIRWLVRAVLDVPGRRDASAEKPIQVQAPTPSSSSETRGADSSHPPVIQSFGECTLSLNMLQVSVACGQTVHGTLRLEVPHPFEVRGVRAELVRMEDAKARKANEIVAREELSGPASLNPYESPVHYAFALAVPTDGPPTTSSPRSSLRWRVRAVLDRPLRTDFSVDQEILVFTGRPVL